MVKFLGLLLIVFASQQVFAQKLMRPYRILKSSEQMMKEAQSAREFFRSALENTAPRKFDLLKYQTPVKNQGERGSCVAFASTALVESMYKVKTGQTVDLSEQYSYWASKAIDGIVPNSDGSYPLPFLKSIEKNGMPAEQAWPYEKIGWFDSPAHPDCMKANQANPDNLPTPCVTNGSAPAAAVAAPKLKVMEPHRVPSSAEAIMGFLQKGMVVEIGADVYQKAWGFDNKAGMQYLTGTVTMPPQGDKLIGGHAVLIVGYDMDKSVFIFKNSWGTERWASKSPVPGFGTIPFDYVRKFAEAVVARMP